MARRAPAVRLAVIVGLLLVVAAGVGIAVAVRAGGPAGARRAALVDERAGASQQDFGSAPAYALTDQNGRLVSSRELAGKVQVVSFLFPYCTTACPRITRTLVLVEQDLARLGLADRVQMVAFNVDPTGAGPAQLRAYLAQYGADPHSPHWTYLTGDQRAVDRAVRAGYHVFYQRVVGAEHSPGGPAQANPLAQRTHVDYDVVHNDLVELVGPDGRIRRVLNPASSVSEDDLLAAVRAVAVGAGSHSKP